MSKKLTNEEYINRVKNITNDIEVIGEYITIDTPIAHKCKKCGYGSSGEWLPRPVHILRNHGCPVCSGNIIGSYPSYKNSIWAQEEYCYFFKGYISEEQMKSNMPNSHAKINMTCKYCGRSKYISPNTLIKQGFGCICGDGISYPNKFMFSFLEQTGIMFNKEQSFEWSEGRIYDFYIPSLNCIIECHGSQHYEGWNHDDNNLKKEEINDEYKKILAIKNGIKDCNYIVIDCRKSNVEFIKDSIISTGLLDMLNCDISNIDFNKCNEFATNNIIKLVCDMWNDGCSVKDIKNKIKTSNQTVIRYLKKGKELKWCNNYTNKESRKRSSSKGIQNLKNSVPIYCKELDCVFKSIMSAERYMGISNVTIGACCRRRLKTANGMHWYYLYDKELDNGIVINGAITLGLITEEDALNQLYTDDDGYSYLEIDSVSCM